MWADTHYITAEFACVNRGGGYINNIADNMTQCLMRSVSEHNAIMVLMPNRRRWLWAGC